MGSQHRCCGRQLAFVFCYYYYYYYFLGGGGGGGVPIRFGEVVVPSDAGVDLMVHLCFEDVSVDSRV